MPLDTHPPLRYSLTQHPVSSSQYLASSIEHPSSRPAAVFRGDRPLTAEQTAIESARLCHELKAEDIVILDMRKLTQICDYFVLATGASDRQLKAIAERIRLHLKEQGVVKLGIEGQPASHWMLLDYCDVIIHIFDPEARAYYQLEMLWGDAPVVNWQDPDTEL